MKHWTHNLPEAGRQMIQIGNAQISMLADIENLKRQLDLLERQFSASEMAAENKALSAWTQDEIEEAKKQTA